MCDALQEIKVTVSVNTGDQLTGGKTTETSTTEDSKKKCKFHNGLCTGTYFGCKVSEQVLFSDTLDQTVHSVLPPSNGASCNEQPFNDICKMTSC